MRRRHLSHVFLVFVKDTVYLIYSIIDKPSQRTINHIRKDFIKDILDPRINHIVKHKTSTCKLFRLVRMANKPKPHDKKAGEGGPHVEGQPGGQGAATTTPPQQQPSPAIPGPLQKL